MSKTPPSTKNPPAATKTERKPRKKPEPDTRPPHVIFGSRFNEELRQMQRRFENLTRLAGARKARGTSAQVEAGITWMETHLAEVAKRLRESTQPSNPAEEAAKKEKGKFSVVPLEPSADQPAAAPAST